MTTVNSSGGKIPLENAAAWSEPSNTQAKLRRAGFVGFEFIIEIFHWTSKDLDLSMQIQQESNL